MPYGHLTPDIERAIIRLLDERRLLGAEPLHGYEIARLLDRAPPSTHRFGSASGLRFNGTVYKALYRLARRGAVVSRWEEPEVALCAGRPRRRYYRLTENGRARARLMDQADRLRARLARDEPGAVAAEVARGPRSTNRYRAARVGSYPGQG